MKKAIFATVLIAISILLLSTCSMTCTDFIIKTKDGAVIEGRSAENEFDIPSNMTFVPRGLPMTADAPGNNPGQNWTTKYAFLGVGLPKQNMYIDGMNEAGLSVSSLWFDEGEYQNVTEKDYDKAIDNLKTVSWLLGNFGTVDEVKGNITKVYVWGEFFKSLNMVFPAHFSVNDAGGKSIVIEYVNGRLNLYDNPTGVMTNNPPFNWHLRNLARYTNLHPESPSSLTFEGKQLAYPGDGSGLFGIPGESTSPSRFVRAALYTKYCDAPQSPEKGVILAAHILNAVDIPIGIARVPASTPVEKEEGSVYRDYTLWVVIYP